MALPTLALVVLWCGAGLALVGSDPPAAAAVTCDIVVAGGSTASLAAAITAAEGAPNLTVCFTEITDWPGGQMTAGGVPAIDFGGSNRHVENQPASFRDFFNHLDGNPGACSVSIKCYDPHTLVDTWIMPRLRRSSNLKVFLRTAVTAVDRDPTSGNLRSITAIQRTPKDPANEWATSLSKDLPDWYSAADSVRFSKEELTLTGKVFIEATELGDILMASDLPTTQGVEVPTELSNSFDNCGQAWTLTFYLTLLAEAPKVPRVVPSGSAENQSWATPTAAAWQHSWSWRRAHCAGNTSLDAANVGDITQQNLGNDLDTAYLLLPLESVKGKPWAGGVNLTALTMLEERAYGYFHWMRNASTLVDPTFPPRVVLNYTTAGTLHGLSKFPYLRDTRRAIGLGGFKLNYSNFDYFNISNPRAGWRFADTIALGNYNDDTHHLTVCPYPPYMLNHTTKPYYIPFRALTVDGAPNTLVAGKTMSQTFHSNGATRLHPSEWTSGVAAAGAAILMVRNGQTTQQIYDNVAVLQSFLNSSVIGQPLEWAGSSGNPNIGYGCLSSVCVGIDHKLANSSVYPNATCSAACRPLASNEWLANAGQWTYKGTYLLNTAGTSRTLKKAITMSYMLPPSMVREAKSGARCVLTRPHSAGGYYFCTIAA